MVTVVSGNSIGCANATTQYHTDNSDFRVFDLSSDHGITGDFYVTRLDVGIALAIGNGGTQPAEIRIHTLSGGALDAGGTLTPAGSEVVAVPDATEAVLPFVLTTPIIVPAGSTMVVEFFTPDGAADGNRLRAGSNANGESSPTYIRAAGCSVPTPMAVGDLGYPDMMWVLSVTGDHDSP